MRRNTSSVRVFHPLRQISSNFFWLLLFRGYTHITLYVGKFCLHVNNSTVLLANTIRLPPLSIRSTKGTNNRKLVFLNNLAISFLIPAKSLKFSSSCSLQNASLVSPYSGFNGRKSYKCLKAIRLRRWKILPCSLESRFFLFLLGLVNFTFVKILRAFLQVKLETRKKRRDSIDRAEYSF